MDIRKCMWLALAILLLFRVTEIKAQTIDIWDIPFGVGLYDGNTRLRGADLDALSKYGLNIREYKKIETVCTIGAISSVIGATLSFVPPGFVKRENDAYAFFLTGVAITALGQIVYHIGKTRIIKEVGQVNKNIEIGLSDNGIGLSLTF